MTSRRRSSPPPDLGHTTHIELGPRRTLVKGASAKVQFPGRATKMDAKFLYADRNGDLTFVDADNKLRTVKPSAVDTIHRTPPR